MFSTRNCGVVLEEVYTMSIGVWEITYTNIVFFLFLRVAIVIDVASIVVVKYNGLSRRNSEYIDKSLYQGQSVQRHVCGRNLEGQLQNLVNFSSNILV